MPTNYNDHKIYIKVVKLQSITRTAEALGLPKSKASRALSKMELIWGAQLLTRSTRSIQVTEAGQLVYQHCINLVADAEKTTEAIETTQHHISGRIRITAPEAFGGLVWLQFCKISWPSLKKHKSMSYYLVIMNH